MLIITIAHFGNTFTMQAVYIMHAANEDVKNNNYVKNHNLFKYYFYIHKNIHDLYTFSKKHSQFIQIAIFSHRLLWRSMHSFPIHI
jgi:hypothetical protein